MHINNINYTYNANYQLSRPAEKWLGLRDANIIVTFLL